MTLAHFVYIPGILVVGIVIGYVLGGRAAMMAKADNAVRDRAREARRARTAARTPDGSESAPPPD